VLALYYLVTETRGLDHRYVVQAYRRALSRACRFHRAHLGAPLSRHLAAYVASLVRIPAAPGTAIYRALGAFTEDGSTERPASWKPGALLLSEARRAVDPAPSAGQA
jgi:hypothetical protein